MLMQKNMGYDVPNGGWGWVVVFSSFMLNFLLDGVISASGQFLPLFMDYFGSNTGETAWIPSILTGMYMISGPVASVLVQTFGHRKVSVCGSIIAAAGLFLSTFSTKLGYMILLYGAVSGFGLGLTYLPSIVLVGQYFDKQRALATGIAVCGSGMGGIIFPPLSIYLIERYNWKGALWIISGIVLNGTVFAALFRGLGQRTIRANQKLKTDKNNTAAKWKILDSESKCRKIKFLSLKPIHHSDMNTTREDKTGETTFIITPSHTSEERIIYNDKCTTDLKIAVSLTKRLKTFVRILDIALLRSPTFVINCISCFFIIFALYMPFIFLPEVSYHVGLSKTQQAMVISTIGIANTIGRVVVGIIADCRWANRLIIYITALFVAGATTLCVPLMTYYWMFILYAIIFGLSIACLVCLLPPILVELLGKEKLTSSFGLSCLFAGISAFIGPPIAGSLVDLTGDFAVSFYVGGCAFIMAGIIYLPLRRISMWEQNTYH